MTNTGIKWLIHDLVGMGMSTRDIIESLRKHGVTYEELCL